MSFIPKNLFIESRKELYVKVNGDNIVVKPAFVAPADSPRFVNSAKKWSKQYDSGSQKYLEGTYINQENVSMK